MSRCALFWMLILSVQFPFRSFAQQTQPFSRHDGESVQTTTPIKHLVVIFDENNSFDHYFGTYPTAKNLPGEPAFHALPDTPTVNGLTDALINANPNTVVPFRLDRSQASTCDNDNHYTDEQKAYDGGLIDKVSELLSGTGAGCTPNLAMGTTTEIR